MAKSDPRPTDRNVLRPRTLYLLYITANSVRSELEQALRPFKLTGIQYSVLSMVDENDPMSSAEIARRFYVTPQTMNETIISLERRDLLARVPDPANMRVRLVVLGDAGRTLLEECAPLVDRIETDAFSMLGDEDLTTLRRLVLEVWQSRHES
ncbi:MarR family winged helix-turn-helix transcriptional regulator [Sagittula stellata]|uniref:Transcriptional regulator, MarR family protein n=1 Tax=Sagittula stellata (strain ATCC 700073 / DSM 11524 / E-37) TaxID=388399 RepID=A3K4A5_SAGS3|nr:MarR family transcriptional regulator [Sagittula stellata]EBA07804.1 transcriptional regulator, MarR family protein [Sagittula stellata E-37]